jgi:hypothetical protein
LYVFSLCVAWHRDNSPAALADDSIFGGWINLDETDQYFSCVPGSHEIDCGIHDGKSGFNSIPKSEHTTLKTERILVRIPPSHILIFFQNIAHEVVPRKQKVHMQVRVMLGWRLTKSDLPLFPDTLQRMRDQAIMQIKSSQMPRMFPKMYFVNHVDRLISFSHSFFVKQCLQVTKRKSEYINIVHAEMPSLKALGLPLFPVYGMKEMSMYIPNHINKYRKL